MEELLKLIQESEQCVNLFNQFQLYLYMLLVFLGSLLVTQKHLLLGDALDVLEYLLLLV